MPITIATWNINSVRLREDLVARVMSEASPDVLCLQECKSPVDKIPLQQFSQLGYNYVAMRGQKGYNGVAIFSKIPMEDAGSR
ncbi:MAG: exodeoxyribonuclease-3, partial [Polaromonas sp.]